MKQLYLRSQPDQPASARQSLQQVVSELEITHDKRATASATVRHPYPAINMAYAYIQQRRQFGHSRPFAGFDPACTYDAMLESLMRLLAARDQYTMGHCERVADLAVQVARSMGLDEVATAEIWRGSLLHDIGKIAVNDSILYKPAALSQEERSLVNKHPLYAYAMLAPLPEVQSSLDIALYHHELWDGSGYPYGLRGAEIPITARVCCVVDVWDALSSHRTYRPAWSSRRVLRYLQERAGSAFDPDVVEAFLSLDEIMQTTTPSFLNYTETRSDIHSFPE